MNPCKITNSLRLLLLAVLPALGLLVLPAAAQPSLSDYATPYTVTNLAGTPGMAGDLDGTNGAAQFSSPGGVAVDYDGNVFVADTFNDTIRKVTLEGTNWVVTTIAGLGGGTNYGASDGSNSVARFYSPSGVAVDTWGNLYVADTDNSTIRKVTPMGTNWVVTTLAGLAGHFDTNDGIGTNARFFYPFGVAVDYATNLYVADLYSCTIRKVAPVGTNWVVTTLAGQAYNPGTNDGIGTNAQFFNPAGVAVDSAGNVFVADTYNFTIRKLTPMGTNWVVTTLAGSAGDFGYADGTNHAARFDYSFGVAVDSADDLYVADTATNEIRKMTPIGTNWVVTTLAGLAAPPGTNNGTGSNALFNLPRGVAVDRARNIYVADTDSDTIRLGIPPSPSEFNAFLPVYQVTQAGATGAQATNLADFLNISNSLLLVTNGLVSFIDPSNFLAVPMTNVTDAALNNSLLAQTSNQYPALPLNVAAIDFTTLSNLMVVPDATALTSAGYNLGLADLSPQFGTPLIDHAMFTAFYSNASATVISNSQPLDTEVDYQFSDLNGYPMIGPGAQVQIDYGTNGNVSRLLYSARQMTPGPNVQIMSPAEASNSVASLFPPNANINLQLVYWCPPLLSSVPPLPVWNPTTIIPWYYCTATLSESNAVSNTVAPMALMAQLIPATTDPAYVPSATLTVTPSTSNVVANVVPAGGTPPYSYLWGASDPTVSTNTSAQKISYTPMIRLGVPTLGIFATSNLITLFWVYPSEDFMLQSTTNLASTNWSQFTNTVQTNFGVNTVMFTNENTVNAQYFRLVLTNQTLPVNETVTVTVTDANGVMFQTNQTVAAYAVPVTQTVTNNTGTNYGSESPFESPYATSLGTADRAGWQSGMNAGAIYQSFCWTGAGSWPGDFIEPPVPGKLPPAAWINGDADFMNSGVNSAEIVLYIGQGNPNEIGFIIDNYGSCLTDIASHLWEPYYQQQTNQPYPYSVTMPDACSLPDINYSVPNYLNSWQNSVSNQSDNLSWLCLLSPDVLDEFDAATNGAWTRWGPAFNGLHLMTGFASDAQAGTGFPQQFANYLLGAAPAPLGSTNVPLTIVQSWLAAASKQGTGAGAVMGPITTNGACNVEDHYWSTGSVGPSIQQSQIQGWWYIH